MALFGNKKNCSVVQCSRITNRCSCSEEVFAPAPNPKPSRWKLLDMVQFANAYVLKVQYLDCTNFEGIKIMVYKGKFDNPTNLDPHFTNDDKSPIARFKPNQKGWDDAIDYANSGV